MDIKRSYSLPFTTQQIYDAWVSSATVIEPATAMDIDPVPGGHYRLLMESEEFTARNEGRFLAVEPGRHLRYTWEWNADGEISEIDVTFSPASVGTTIDINHSGFKHAQSVANHTAGWDNYMQGLETFLGEQSG